MRYHATLFLSLLAVSACTQPPANVDMKGHYSFNRNGEQQNSRSYASGPRFVWSNSARTAASHSSQPAYANQNTATGPTERAASISSIGVSDLPPPSAASPPVSETSSVSAEPWRADNTTIAAKPVESPVINSTKGGEVALIKDSKKSGFIWPVSGHKILSGYGPKGSGKANDGINIAASEGEPVWAVADGEVVFVGDELSGYGNMVLVKHAGDHTTTYAHLNQPTVEKYDRVKQGDIIGYVGTTGNVKSPQLYFAVRDGKDPIDPQKFLKRNLAGL